jgi:hypothetical protein
MLTLWCTVKGYVSNAPKIVITTDGKITTAKMYENGKVVKTAEAKCCPEDTFDFNVGAKLAVDRLIGKSICAGEEKKDEIEWKVVKRPVKVGDYIRLINTPYSFDKIGDILKVDHVDCCAVVYQKNHPKKSEMVIPPSSNFRWNYRNSMYEVVEKVTKEVKETPKYYNGKVVCTNAGYVPEDLTVGKIYTFVDGMCKLDSGNNLTRIPVKDVNDLNNRFIRAKFIEVVE